MIEIEGKQAVLSKTTTDLEKRQTTLALTMSVPQDEAHLLERAFPGIAQLVDTLEVEERAPELGLSSSLGCSQLRLQIAAEYGELLVDSHSAQLAGPKVTLRQGRPIELRLKITAILSERDAKRLAECSSVVEVTLAPAQVDLEDRLRAQAQALRDSVPDGVRMSVRVGDGPETVVVDKSEVAA